MSAVFTCFRALWLDIWNQSTFDSFSLVSVIHICCFNISPWLRKSSFACKAVFICLHFPKDSLLSWPDPTIYLLYFIHLNFPKTSLFPDRSCCMFVLFHLSALSNNLLQPMHRAGPLLHLLGWQQMASFLFQPTSFLQQFTLTPCILQDLGRNCVRTESLRRQNKTRMVSNTSLLHTGWCIYLALHIFSIAGKNNCIQP